MSRSTTSVMAAAAALLPIGVAGMALTSIAMCRFANASFSGGAQLECSTVVRDRHSGGNHGAFRLSGYVARAPLKQRTPGSLP